VRGLRGDLPQTGRRLGRENRRNGKGEKTFEREDKRMMRGRVEKKAWGRFHCGWGNQGERQEIGDKKSDPVKVRRLFLDEEVLSYRGRDGGAGKEQNGGDLARKPKEKGSESRVRGRGQCNDPDSRGN